MENNSQDDPRKIPSPRTDPATHRGRVPRGCRRVLLAMGHALLRIVAGVAIVSLIIFGLLFLTLGATWKGWCVGLSITLLGGMLFCCVGYWERRWFQSVRKSLFRVVVPAALLLYLVPLVLAPRGGSPDARIRNCYLNKQSRFSRFSPLNVIPEKDQLHVGMCLLPQVDPYVSSAKGRRIRSLVLPACDRLDESPSFYAVGSALGPAWRDFFQLEFRNGHYFLLLPENATDEPRRVLIFLHGLGGNIKPYLWVFEPLLQEKDCIVVVPTFGLGNWDKPGGAEFIVEVTNEVMETLPVDRDQIFLMGYSNGAVGVTHAAARAPDLYRGLIYLSPVTDDRFLSNDFKIAAAHCRFLFLHGSTDQRIPKAAIASAVTYLKMEHANVRRKMYDEEDHYLLFSQPDALLRDVETFMGNEIPVERGPVQTGSVENGSVENGDPSAVRERPKKKE